MRLNSSNPLVWWSLSAGKLYSGEAETSFKMASLARKLAAFSPYGFWWDIQKAAAALIGGQLETALKIFEAVHDQRPEFRPPLRYMTALYAHFEQDRKALEAALKLTELESDFSIERMLNDKKYPASLIWRDNGLDVKNLKALV